LAERVSESVLEVDFSATNEQRALEEEFSAFGREVLTKLAHRIGGGGVSIRDVWRECAQHGLHGLVVDQTWGGRGLSASAALAALEGLGYGCTDNGILFAMGAQQWSFTLPLIRFGTHAQQAGYLPRICDGSLIATGAITEPNAGSDSLALETTATGAAGGYVLNGRKTLITSAPIADWFLVFAATDSDSGIGSTSAFLVASRQPGVIVHEPLMKMGLAAADMGDIEFRDCRLDADALVGEEGGGYAIFSTAMEWERTFILAPALGTMRRQLERCIQHAQTRRQFSHPLGDFQAVAHRIVSMKLRLDTSRLLLYRVAWLKEQGRPAAQESALAKLQVSEALLESSLDALQIHGGKGYLVREGLECDVRDAVAARLYSGTSEIQRNNIAASLGL